MPSNEEIEAAAKSLCKEQQHVKPEDCFINDPKFTWMDFFKPVARFALEAAEKVRNANTQ